MATMNVASTIAPLARPSRATRAAGSLDPGRDPMTRTLRITPAIALAALALLVVAAAVVALTGVVDPAMAGLSFNALD